jgi:hypothetical protein
MSDYSDLSLDDLIELITAWPVGMPVRAMERVLAIGENAAPALIDALQRWTGDDQHDVLWLIVLLGELKNPIAIQPLIDQVQRTDDDELSRAAAEGLSEIGAAALPALSQLATAPDPVVRIHVYSALGGISDDGAFAILIDRLPRNPNDGDALAQALCDQGRKEAIPFLYDAYCKCDPWQRIEFEEVIRKLHFGRTDSVCRRNWRTHYRRNPSVGTFELGWLGERLIIRDHYQEDTKKQSPPLRTLEEILEEKPESMETCEDCSGKVENPTGLPVCPETAVSVALCQVRFLGEMREDGMDDIFEISDMIDDMLWDYHEREEPKKAREDDSETEKDELHMYRQTCAWLVEQGTNDVTEARAMLLAKAGELAARLGDPEGLLTRLKPPQKSVPKIGRNDPCPCGSGVKYKRCCLKNAAKNAN